MCGIYGEWSQTASNGSTPGVLDRMVSLMARRGPDDSGTWSDGIRCQLGFRRLSILDLSELGHQPMSTADGRFSLVFNGELYNFRELRNQLRKENIELKSSGDAEVVLHTLATWGKRALNLFNGMFALAMYDEKTGSLLLARDHAGIKPLYYGWCDRGLVFGSQFNQILTHPWFTDSKISQDALGLYLRLGYIPAPHALLTGSHMLEAGSWLEVSPNSVPKTGHYYVFPNEGTNELKGREADEAVYAAVGNAVKRCMVSDVPVGSFLSGGIDSPLIASCIAQNHGSVQTFTIGTAGDKHDESRDAEHYAQEFGHESRLLHLNSDDAVNLLDEVVSSVSEPFADSSIFPSLLVSKLASEHVKVVLSGDGGDEMFWGYADRYSLATSRSSEFETSRSRRLLRWYASRLRKTCELVPFQHGFGDWYLHKYSKFKQPWLGKVFPTLPDWPNDCNDFTYRGHDHTQAAQFIRWSGYRTGLQMINLKVDRASMHHSLEVRVPLLDREVIDVATRIDWRTCLDTKKIIGKKPLRNALAMNSRFQTKKKRGFSIAMDRWLRTSLKDRFCDMVLQRDDYLGLPVNKRSIKIMFDEHLSERTSHAQPLWMLLSLALWIDHHYATRKIPAPSCT